MQKCAHLQFLSQIFFLTIHFWLATVLLTLSLGVELVGVSLAEVLFVGHTQTIGGVEGPDEQLARAGLTRHG